MPSESEQPTDRSTSAERRIRDSLENPPLLNLLWLPLVLLVGLPLLVWGASWLSELLGIGTRYILISLFVLIAALTARRGWSPRLLSKHHRIIQDELNRPGLARALSRLEPWIFVLAGMFLCTALLARVFEGAELGMGGMIFVFGGWYVGAVLGFTLAMYTRDYLRDRYTPRLLIGGIVTALLIVKFSAYLSTVA